MNDNHGGFGARLRASRVSAGLSQEDLAERSGLSVRAISNLERGRARWPYRETLYRLADALGLSDASRAEFISAADRRLATGRGTADARPAGGASARADGERLVPRQLPAATAHFAGRMAELKLLADLLNRPTAPGGTVVISAIGGTAGVGKTALAVHFAHQVADAFPDRQLYIDLRGFGPSVQPVSATEAIRAVLDVLEVPADRIPASLDAQAGLYRTLLAGRQMLIVLDNARDTDQVRPLLPGSPGCLVLVTSRNQLTGLVVAEGARLISLDVLSEAEARELLTGRLGRQRIRAEPEAVTELIRLCARLPLALSIAAARAVTRPASSLAAVTAGLRDARERLDALDAGDAATSMQTVLSWSYQQLSEPAARMFRMLGIHRGPSISAPAAASLAGVSPSQARRLLGELTRANMLSEHTGDRYGFHDLLRVYATGRARLHDGQEDCRAATYRVLDHYLHSTQAAVLVLNPGRDPLPLAVPCPGAAPEPITSLGEALKWFIAERDVLIGAVKHAAEEGFEAHAWQIAWNLGTFLDWHAHWHDWADTQRIALSAARRTRDKSGEAYARRGLGRSCLRLGRYEEARRELGQALALYLELGDLNGQAYCDYDIAFSLEREGRYREAADIMKRALGTFESLENKVGQAITLNAVGWCLTRLGDLRPALPYCQRAVDIAQEISNRMREADAWDSVGYVRHELGQYHEAGRCYRQAIHIYRELDDDFDAARSLVHLGDSHHASRDLAAARKAWQQALETFDELHHPDADEVRTKLRTLEGRLAEHR